MLQIFNEKTIAALKCHPELEPSPGTATFIEKILEFWNIVNVLTPNLEKRFKCPSKSAIYARNDHNLNKLLDIATFDHEMSNKGGQRVKTLTKDTGSAVFQTCHRLLRELSIHLLEEKLRLYVLLGQFSSDPIEKAFSKLRQGSGGAYFVTVVGISDKLALKKSQLYLKFQQM